MSKPKTVRTVDAKIDRLRRRVEQLPSDAASPELRAIVKGVLDLLDEELV